MNEGSERDVVAAGIHRREVIKYAILYILSIHKTIDGLLTKFAT